MRTLTQNIVKSGLAGRIIRVEQLSRLLEGSRDRRYGLVNRALKNGELLRVQRGLYVLAQHYSSRNCHPFALAQALAPGSYVSFETALAYHGWIPEKVFSTVSVIPGRRSRLFENEVFGSYHFHPLAIHRGFFLELVNRHIMNGHAVLLAEPCRALMDLVCLRKERWQGIGWLTDGLRIHPDMLLSVTERDINILRQTYKHKRVQLFLAALASELNID
jgi:predicted transcriptional regulator of viral defense system